MGMRIRKRFLERLALSRTSLLVLLLWFPWIQALAAQSSDPQVIQFTPQGTVKKVRQVTARFSEPMVPLGDSRGILDPFEITCPEPGTARWADSSNWVYDFARDLPAGVRCTFRLVSSLSTLSGKPVGGQQSFSFSTGGSAIRVAIPGEGNQAIDEEQAFLLILDAEPTEQSLLQHVSFSVQGIAERIGIRPITGSARDEILKSRYQEPPKEPIVILQAQRRFPHNARVTLVWGRGVTTATGVPTDQDQRLSYKTRGPFAAEFSCERENPQAGCVPVTPMTVKFSAPVPWDQARQITLVGPTGQRWPLEEPKTRPTSVRSVVFQGPFPESTAFRVEIPRGFRDDAGRTLSNAGRFPLQVKTEPFPPLAKFAARFGIIEWKADPTLPVTLRNLEPQVKARLLRVDKGVRAGAAGRLQDFLEQVKGRLLRIPPQQTPDILPWLRRVATSTREVSVLRLADSGAPTKDFMVPKAQGAKAFEVVGIPLERPGLYVVELESPRLGASLLGKPASMFVPTAALVTNLSVHFKWGREVSLAWVTALDTGRPVANARVTVQDCHGATLWSGDTDRQGIAQIRGIPTASQTPQCPPIELGETFEHYPYPYSSALANLHSGLYVLARTVDDLSFVHTSWERGIESWRFRLPTEWLGDFEEKTGRIAVHTIFDRSLLRAGETVHMKHLIRAQSLRGFSHVPEHSRPPTLAIQHLGSEQKYELPLRWDAAGIAESSWQIPKDAKLGNYHALMRLPGSPPEERVSGGFRVEGFRLAIMRGRVQLPADPQVAASEVPVDLSVQYLAGGGARDLPVILRSQLRPRPVPSIDTLEDFTFANGSVKEGLSHTPTSDWEDYLGESAGEFVGEVEGEAAKPGVHQRQELVLDATGGSRTTITRLPRPATPLDLLAEMEFRDPNGETRTVSATVPLWPAHWLVGIQPESWVASKDRLKAWVAVVDISRRPAPGVPVQVDLLQRMNYSHRKRLVGGFYAYEHVQEVRRVGVFCRGQTDAKGRLLCEGKPPVDGNLILQASATDRAGNHSTAHQDVWVAGSEQWWFDVQDHDRMDLLPERRRYEPGETARLQVRMPFREATALVTVEREGILEASVVSLSGAEPVIEVPVKGEFAPNVFVSVLAVRGRVGGIQPTALVDLGRPAFKLGITELQVGWRAHELKVTVTPERGVYRVRDKAVARISVRKPDGQPPASGTEVAVAVVDEGLLELMPNRSWNVLEWMMSRRSYSVQTATAQMQVVGKRHYGRKALPHGGGGGRQVTRELFDTLLLWKARVPVDAKGEATVEIPLNDSLTSFRIVAVATAGTGLFGTGSATIRSTQDLIILAGLPPLVREGDRFPAEFTVRNTTNRVMDVTVQGRVEGVHRALELQPVKLSPGEAKTVQWEVSVPVGPGPLRYELQAQEPGGAADRVRMTQEVRPAVPIRTFQATLFRWEQTARQPVELPSDAIPGRGGVQVALSPTLVDGLTDVRATMLEYPYSCLEQRVSTAVVLRDEARWRGLVAELPAYQDRDGLLKYFPTMPEGSEILTAYVMSVIHETGWTIPAGTLQLMQTGLRKFVDGTVNRRSELPTADLSIRKLSALEALSRHAKADAQLLSSLAIEPNLWPTSALLDWWNLLHRVQGIPDRDARLKEVEQIVRARLNFQGTVMGFSTERSDFLWWLMVSPDVNAVRLILNLLEAGQWSQDLPRLVRGAVARQHRGTWSLTVANAWGVLAMEKFSKAFERTPITGVTTASLAAATQRQEWAQNSKGKTLSLPWSPRADDLTVSHEGTGNPWVTVQARAAIPLKTPLSTGYKIARTLIPIEQKQPGRWSRGDIIRVRLAIEAQSDMTWIVVNDPIPAGASHLGTGLGGDSTIAIQGQRREGWSWPAFEERAFDGFRAYYRFVPKGAFTVEYTIRLNQTGRFQLPTTRVEALYSPETFGELPNDPVEILP